MQQVSWMTALGATLLMQSVASFMGQCLPVVAPLLTAQAGVGTQAIGVISALTSAGTVLFLAFGGPLLVRMGPVRMLQAGSLLGAASLAICASGWWPALLVAALLLGVGYGPTPPAGSRILAETVPAQHRTLIFSIKQAGAPAGGALAGLLVAPTASRFGWEAGLTVGVLAGVLAALAIAPLRGRMDVERDPSRPIGPRALFRWRTLREPAVSLLSDPLLVPITLLGTSFAVVQGNLFSFSVSYLAIARGLTLAQAGMAYACMQGAGVFARVFLGWLADRTGRAAVNLTVQAYVAAVLVAAFGCLPASASLLMVATLAGAVGFVAASWNGIVMAEVARLAPLEKVAVATAGSTVFLFLGYVAGPAAFSALVTMTGSWRLAFLLTAGQLAVFAAAQTAWLASRRTPLPLRACESFSQCRSDFGKRPR
jgi:MFS family permease